MKATRCSPFDQWEKGDMVGFAGLIASRPSVIRLAGNRTMTRFTVISWNQEIQVTVFNRPWLNAFPFGQTIFIRGTYQGAGKSLPCRREENRRRKD